MTWVVRAIRSSGGVARPRSVIFSPSTMYDRDEIWVAKGRRRAGDGPDRRQSRQPRAPHGKAQFGWFEARRMRLSVRTRAQNALSRDVPRPECAFPSRRGAREVWGNPPPGCGALWRMSQLGKCARATPPPGCGVGCAGVRKSRLGVWSHGKAHSAAGASRKGAFCPGASPKTALCARRTPSTWYRAALASLITKGVVLKAPVLVDAIAVDLVLGYAYTARVEDRDARVRMPIGVRLEHPLVRVSVHKGCPRR